MGFALVVGERSVRALSPYIPAILIGLAATGLLVAEVSPAWWITALVAVGLVLVAFMGGR